MRLRQNNAYLVLRHRRDMLASLRWLAIDLIYWSGFNPALKVTLDCYAPALLCYVIGPENSHHSLNKSASQFDQLHLSQFRFSALQVVCLFLLWDLIGCLWCFPLFSVIDFDEFAFDFTTINTLPPPWQSPLELPLPFTPLHHYAYSPYCSLHISSVLTRRICMVLWYFYHILVVKIVILYIIRNSL